MLPGHPQEDSSRAPTRRYFFDVHEGDVLIQDHEGTEIDGGPDAVAEEAARILVVLAKDRLPGAKQRDMAVFVRTETGPVLNTTLSFLVERPS